MNKTLWISKTTSPTSYDQYFLSVDQPRMYTQSDGRTKYWSAIHISRICPAIAFLLLEKKDIPEHTPHELLLTTK